MKRLILILLLSSNCFASAIAQWKMNDNSASSNVADSVSSYTGTFHGTGGTDDYTSAHTTTGQINAGLELDGTNDYIQISDADSFSPVGSAFSIAAWVSLVGAESAVEFEILNKYETGHCEWSFKISGDVLYFNLWDNTNGGNIGRKDTADYSAWEDAGFIFVVATYDGSNTSAGVKLYLNGTQADDADEENGSYTALENTDSDLRIGYLDDSPNKASGVIDNVIIFNTELTQSQIDILYNGGEGTEDISLGINANMRSRYSDGYRKAYRDRYNF
jgi:hypothetical protein